MNPLDFFFKPTTIAQKQYEALRLFFVEKISAAEVAKKFGYTTRGFNTISADFRKDLKNGSAPESLSSGRPKTMVGTRDGWRFTVK